MGIFDRARDALQDHADKIGPALDRLADEADQRSGGKHSARIDRGAALAKDKLDDLARRGTTPEADPPA